MKIKFMSLIGIVFALLAVGFSLAQGGCPALVEQALKAIGDNCADVARNNACYGYNLVSAEFAEAVEDDFFVDPADIASLDIIQSIKTAGMNTDLSQWGVAVLNLQTNLPNTLPGQAVKFVLLGDVELENAVEPSNSFQPSEGIEAVALQSANIRSGTGLAFNVIGGLTQGASVVVDGKSADGEWYRTVVGSRIGWIFGELLESDDALADLPVIDGVQRTSMQSFYLKTGFGEPTCEEAPQDTLMIQGPQGIEIDFTVNGADIRIGSTIMIRTLQPGNRFEIGVIDGHVTVPGGGPDGTDLIIYEGQRSTTCLNDEGEVQTVGCEWSEPENIPPSDVGSSGCTLENIPESLLNYSIDVACPGEEPIQVIFTEEPDPPANETENEDDPNLCAEGNAWDDGRCTDEYWWQAGYYFGLVEEGEIDLDDVPGPFYETPTPEPTDEPKKDKKKSIYCSVYYDEEGELWDIYEIASGNYVDYTFENPGYPSCPPGYAD